jgi:hypothetical protein
MPLYPLRADFGGHGALKVKSAWTFMSNLFVDPAGIDVNLCSQTDYLLRPLLG